MKNKLKYWFLEPRPPFLILTILLVSLGTLIARYDGYLNVRYFLLALLGMLLAHIGGNVLNDYFDYKSGLDLKTQKTPFSGGSGILPAGHLTPRGVYWLGTVSLFLAFLVGVYFIRVRGWLFLPVMVIGGLSAYFYSTKLAKWYVGELAAGINFGPVAVLGAYFVQTGEYSLNTLAASLIPGILGTNLLILNQFPDTEHDRQVGRRHLVIKLGKARSARLFTSLLVIMYLWLITAVGLRLMPPWTLLGLASLPLAIISVMGAFKNYDDMKKFVGTMGINIANIIVTQLLIITGYAITIGKA